MDSIKKNLPSIGLLWLRVLMGLGIAIHGYGKLFEPGRMEKFTEGVAKMGFPIPEFFAWSAALSEFGGGLLIALGLGTRIAAFFVFCTMSVAAFIRHGADPFSVKELALAYWTMATTLMLTGGGTYSLEYWIQKRRLKNKSSTVDITSKQIGS